MECISAVAIRLGFSGLLRVPEPRMKPSAPLRRMRLPTPIPWSCGSFFTGFICPHPDRVASVASGAKVVAWKIVETVDGEKFTKAL
jgi:hypothetical protein